MRGAHLSPLPLCRSDDTPTPYVFTAKTKTEAQPAFLNVSFAAIRCAPHTYDNQQ